MFSLKGQLAESDNERRSLEQGILQLRNEVESLARAREDAGQDASRFRSAAELLGR